MSSLLKLRILCLMGKPQVYYYIWNLVHISIVFLPLAFDKKIVKSRYVRCLPQGTVKVCLSFCSYPSVFVDNRRLCRLRLDGWLWAEGLMTRWLGPGGCIGLDGWIRSAVRRLETCMFEGWTWPVVDWYETGSVFEEWTGPVVGWYEIGGVFEEWAGPVVGWYEIGGVFDGWRETGERKEGLMISWILLFGSWFNM